MGGFLHQYLYVDFWVPVWPNLAAGIVVAVWVTLKLRAQRDWQAEMKRMHERHHAEQMAALAHDTPGGLSAVMSEVKDAKIAAERSAEAMKMLTSVLKPKTPMVKKVKAPPRQPDCE